jgi:hypothetical protein
MSKGEAASQQHLIGSPEKTKQRMAHHGSGSVLQLHRMLGNQRVAQLIQAKRLTPQGKILGLQPKQTVGAADDQYEQEADRVARQVMTTPNAISGVCVTARNDIEVDRIGATIAAPHAAPEEAQQTVEFPDIHFSAIAPVASADSISGKLGHKATIVNGTGILGAADFGATGWRDVNLSDIVVTPVPKKKAFKVTARANVTITWEVQSGLGPSNQVSIGSATDPSITKTNWPDVVKDLTPDKGGVTPRTKFWCRDLTEQHELHHAKELKAFLPAAVKTVNTWLNAQTVKDVNEVNTQLTYVPSRVYEALTDKYMPGSEERAYRALGPSFKARADAIRKRGKRGAYP